MCTVLLSADPTYEKKKPNILRVFNLRNTLDHHDLYQGHLGSLSKRPETCARIRHCTWLGLAGGGQRLPSLYRRNESRSAKHAKKKMHEPRSPFSLLWSLKSGNLRSGPINLLVEPNYKNHGTSFVQVELDLPSIGLE